jgi:hypothetical protein
MEVREWERMGENGERTGRERGENGERMGENRGE